MLWHQGPGDSREIGLPRVNPYLEAASSPQHLTFTCKSINPEHILQPYCSHTRPYSFAASLGPNTRQLQKASNSRAHWTYPNCPVLNYLPPLVCSFMCKPKGSCLCFPLTLYLLTDFGASLCGPWLVWHISSSWELKNDKLLPFQEQSSVGIAIWNKQNLPFENIVLTWI